MQPTGQHWWVSALALAPTHTALDAWLSNEPCAEGTTTPGSTLAPHLCASAAQQSLSGMTISGLQATATCHCFSSASRWSLGVCVSQADPNVLPCSASPCNKASMLGQSACLHKQPAGSSPSYVSHTLCQKEQQQLAGQSRPPADRHMGCMLSTAPSWLR